MYLILSEPKRSHSRQDLFVINSYFLFSWFSTKLSAYVAGAHKPTPKMEDASKSLQPVFPDLASVAKYIKSDECQKIVFIVREIC